MVRQGMAPTEVDPEVPLLELRVIVREIALEVMLIEVQALEAISPIEVRHQEQVAIAPREAEVQVQGVVEATAPEGVTEALGEATEAPGGRTDLQVVVGLREAVDLQVEAEEVEEIKPI